MEKIEVTTRKGATGSFYPTSFTWNGQVYHVESVGRRWQGEDGEHMLVMTLPENRAFEIVFDTKNNQWGMIKGHDRPTVTRI